MLWEYKTVTINPGLPFTNEIEFNKHGSNGWELVCLDGISGVAYFKKPKIASENKND